MTDDTPELPDNVTALPGTDPGALLRSLLAASGVDQDFGLPRSAVPELLASPGQTVRFTVRLDLDGAKPPIWRRLELAGDLTLDELHEVVQVAMGWTDTHLHHFIMGPDSRHITTAPFLTEFAEMEGEDGIPEQDVRLDQVVAEAGHRLFYEYDFGDGWGYTLKVGTVTGADAAAPRARCLTGRRACPPEDVGGIPGYLGLLDALADPSQADEWMQERIDDWLPEDFDPAEFDVEEADELVRDVVE